MISIDRPMGGVMMDASGDREGRAALEGELERQASEQRRSSSLTLTYSHSRVLSREE